MDMMCIIILCSTVSVINNNADGSHIKNINGWYELGSISCGRLSFAVNSSYLVSCICLLPWLANNNSEWSAGAHHAENKLESETENTIYYTNKKYQINTDINCWPPIPWTKRFKPRTIRHVFRMCEHQIIANLPKVWYCTKLSLQRGLPLTRLLLQKINKGLIAISEQATQDMALLHYISFSPSAAFSRACFFGVTLPLHSGISAEKRSAM